MRQKHKAGEKLFVDYAGQTIPVVDSLSGHVREAQLFLAVLGASNYTFAEATWSQTLPDWIGSHVRALEYLGGVPEVIVPDNLKSGVTSPCRYEPELNPTYREFAAHYSVSIIPARVRKPRDKAKVENGVLQAERWILAPLRNRTFFDLAELNNAIRERLVEINNRPFQKLEGSRATAFEKIDRPALRPCPIGAMSMPNGNGQRLARTTMWKWTAIITVFLAGLSARKWTCGSRKKPSSVSITG